MGLFFWVLAIFFLASPVQEPPLNSAAKVTLGQAIDEALLNNKTLDNVRKSLTESEITYRAIKKNRLPKLSTGYSYMGLKDEIDITTTDPTTGDSFQIPVLLKDNYTWTTTLSMPIYLGGAQQLSEDIAKLGIDVSKVRLVQGKNELLAAVKFHYYGVLKEMKSVEFLEQNLASYEKHETEAVKFHRQGQIAKNVVLQAKVERANAQQELAAARQNVEISNSSLNIVMGRDVSREFVPEDVLGVRKFELSLDDCQEYAKKNNPELVVFTYIKQQAEKAIRIENAYYIPTVTLSASYMKYGNNPGMAENDILPNSVFYAMLNLHWNFFDWGQKSDEAKIKKVQLEQIINNEKVAQDNVALRIKEWFSRMTTAQENIGVSEMALSHARENVRIVNVRFRELVAPSSEVIDAMTALRKAEYNYYDALYSHNVAVAELERAIGIDVEKIIKTEK